KKLGVLQWGAKVEAQDLEIRGVGSRVCIVQVFESNHFGESGCSLDGFGPLYRIQVDRERQPHHNTQQCQAGHDLDQREAARAACFTIEKYGLACLSDGSNHRPRKPFLSGSCPAAVPMTQSA